MAVAAALALDRAIESWHQDTATSLDRRACLGDIDRQQAFSASNAPARATLFLRAVHVPGHSGEWSWNEALRDALVQAGLVNDASLAKVRDVFGWDWPARSQQPGPPSTPPGRSTMPKNQPARHEPPEPESEHLAPHDLFLKILSDMQSRDPDAEAAETQPRSFGEALGPFGHAWIKYRRMNDGLFPHLSPPKLRGYQGRRGTPDFVPDDRTSPIPQRVRSDLPPLLPDSPPTQAADAPLLDSMEKLMLAESSSIANIAPSPRPAPETPMARSESLMVEFLAEFLNSLSLQSQAFNPSKFPIYVSESHQRRFVFGPGRGSKGIPSGSFTARVDGYISRPGRPGTGADAGVVGADLKVWVIHEVKKHSRQDAGDQLGRQEMCEFAAWAYETRDGLRKTLRETRSPVWLPLLALDETEFWFQLARVTEEWLDYIVDPNQPVVPADGAPLPPEAFLQIYEYGPFEVESRQRVKTVGIAVLAMIYHDMDR